MTSKEEALERAKACLEVAKAHQPQKMFSASLFKFVTVESSEILPNNRARTVFRVRTDPSSMLNTFGTVHGGCIATLVDELTSYNICVLDTFWTNMKPEDLRADPQLGLEIFPFIGVTRNLQVTYIAAVENKDILYETTLEGISGRFFHLTCRGYDDSGKNYFFGIHDKVRTAHKA